MLVNKKYEFDRSYKEILQKGTVALLTTLGAGALFGMENMMIAFVLVLGASALSIQNLRIKTANKTLRLITVDLVIVGLAYLASLSPWWAVPINLLTLFGIIYVTVSPYNQISYKTFMMLFVFCQYTSVPLERLPRRIMVVAFSVIIVMLNIYWEQGRLKALLPPQIQKGFELINKQIGEIIEGRWSETLSEKISGQMNELAYVIYQTSYRRYFTTYIGKVHFHFYLNMSYLNFLLEQVAQQAARGIFSKDNLAALKKLFESIEVYFKRKMTREELIAEMDSYLSIHEGSSGFNEEVYDVIYALRKNFKELDKLCYKKKNQVYDDWGRSDLSSMQSKITKQLKPKTMSFNFAARMSIILTVMLALASWLGFYKFIWAIIPIMSISQPYYEDTRRRGKDRIKSNILASIGITLVVNVIHVDWIAFVLLAMAFYLIYAYKDYYHMSIFLTIISMSVSSFTGQMNVLVFYRIIYVLLGAGIVEVTSRWMPYKLEDGIQELVRETEHLNEILERESILSLEGKADLNRIREAIIYSAVLCQKLYLKNKQYQNEKVKYLISTNSEFVIRLGHSILRNQ